ncbi:MAG: CBS domain-containing protein [Rhodospirillales bacterium]|nr:CBS domain-containing protein [Rhodospirillales bacterium]
MSKPKPYVKVRDVMSPNVDTIEGLETVDVAIRHMKEKRFGALIVARRDEADEYGLVTVQDIARHVIEPDLSPERVSVYEIMEKPVLTIHGDMNIRYAIRLMERIGQLRALVIDNNEAVGIITMLDMVTRYMDVEKSA